MVVIVWPRLHLAIGTTCRVSGLPQSRTFRKTAVAGNLHLPGLATSGLGATLEDSLNGNGLEGHAAAAHAPCQMPSRETCMEPMEWPQLYDLPMQISLQDCIEFIIAPTNHVNQMRRYPCLASPMHDCIYLALTIAMTVALACGMCRSRGTLPKLRLYQPQSRDLRLLRYLDHHLRQHGKLLTSRLPNMFAAVGD